VVRFGASDEECSAADSQIADDLARLETLDDEARKLAEAQICALLGPPR